MPDWNQGYTTEIDYTHGFYRELTPSILTTAALARGYAPPRFDEPLTYCELGCGYGYTTNVLAAANPGVEFYATDFNPTHIAHARRLAREGELENVHFSDAAFADYIDDPTLPDFDFVTLHGIYSWVTLENRAVIIDFLRRKLKPGGYVYISYNCEPGWSAAAPLRRLMYEHGKTSGGGVLQRVDKALAFIQQLNEAKVRYFAGVTGMTERIEGLGKHNRQYVAHEYFNREWRPLYFADAVEELGAAKLSWAGSVHLLDHIDAANYTAEHRALLTQVGDPVLQETLRDYMTMQTFRRDLFGKGLATLSTPAIQQAWSETRLALTQPWPGFDLKIKGALGDAELQADSYKPILDQLAGGPKTIAQLLQDKAVVAFGWTRLLEVLRVIIGAGWVQPCAHPKDDPKRTQKARTFNNAVMRRSIASIDYNVVASPVTGGGVNVDRFHQMFLLAQQEKHPDPPMRAWEQIQAQGHALLRDGKPMEKAEDNIAELRTRYETFNSTVLPLLKQLGIA